MGEAVDHAVVDVGGNDDHGLQVGAEVPGVVQVEPEDGAGPAVVEL